MGGLPESVVGVFTPGSGENRDRDHYLGVEIPSTNLQDYHLDAARKFADGLADRLLASSIGAQAKGRTV